MKKRELSEFMTQELLYDFATDRLDSERRYSVKEILSRSEEIKSDLDTIQTGIQYLESLSKVSVSARLIEEVAQKETYWGQIQKLMKFETWPPFLKWTFEAAIVISVVVTVSLFAPWTQITEFLLRNKTSELILAELPRDQFAKPVESIAQAPSDANFYEDENTSGTSLEQLEKKVTSNSATATSGSKPPTTEVVSAKAASLKAVSISSEKEEDGKKKGYVFRGTLNIVNVAVGTAKLKEKLVELGGRKAGEVELGWKRNGGDYYFHFTIPESKLEELQAYFRTLGTIKVSKDPHPRIMPDGIVRMIITTEESK